MTEAVTAKGTQLFVKAQIGEDESEKWHAFAEVSAVPEMGSSTEQIDVTHLTSDMKEYVKDIPDFSSELEFTMNAMPKKSTDSNLDLITSLDEDATYEWKISYPQLKTQVSLKAQYSWRMGAAAVSTKQDIILTLIPRSKAEWADYAAEVSLNYADDQTSDHKDTTDEEATA